MLRDNVSIAMFVIGVVSCLFSSSIIATWLAFPKLRAKYSVEIVVYLAICNLFTSIGAALGKQSNDKSPECFLQAILTIYFLLAGTFWLVVIVMQLHSILIHGRIVDKNQRPYFQIICWGFPLLSALLPLSTSTFGTHENEDSWCFIQERNDSSAPKWVTIFWIWTLIYGWIWLSVLRILYYFVDIYRRYGDGCRLRLHRSELYDVAKLYLRKLVFYPLIVAFCWIIPTYVEMHRSFFYNVYLPRQIVNLSNIVPIFQGIFTAIVFFQTNPDYKTLWYRYLSGEPSNQESVEECIDEENMNNRTEQNSMYQSRPTSIFGGGLSPGSNSVEHSHNETNNPMMSDNRMQSDRQRQRSSNKTTMKNDHHGNASSNSDNNVKILSDENTARNASKLSSLSTLTNLSAISGEVSIVPAQSSVDNVVSTLSSSPAMGSTHLMSRRTSDVSQRSFSITAKLMEGADRDVEYS